MGNFFLQKKVGVSIAMFDDWLVIYFQWDDSPQLLADFEDVFFKKIQWEMTIPCF